VAADGTIERMQGAADGPATSPPSVARFEFGPKLGAGAFAVVWRARDTALDEPVAIKVLAENWAADLGVRDRFLEEARALRQARSERLAAVFDIGELEACDRRR
jgi:eukaryotic-like serine/threonine-protein kinase